MALSITINKVAQAVSFAAGAIVATAVASGGITYTYSLATGSDEFSINSTTGAVTVKALMDSTNIKSFSITATSGADTITSEVVYPNIIAAIQNKFSKANMIYKITKDIDLNRCILTIPAGCTLDFQGGSFTNGLIILSATKVLPLGCNISEYVLTTISGTYKAGQILYDSALLKCKLWNGTSWVNLDGAPLT